MDFVDEIVSALLRGGANEEEKVSGLLLMSSPALLSAVKDTLHKYDDLRFYLLLSVSKECQKQQTASGNSEETERFVLNAFQLLHKLPHPEVLERFYLYTPQDLPSLMQPKKKEPKSFSDLYQAGTKRKRSQAQSEDADEVLAQLRRVFVRKEHRKAFEAAWKELLRLPLSPLVYKQILLDMPQHVLPYFAKPEQIGRAHV